MTCFLVWCAVTPLGLTTNPKQRPLNKHRYEALSSIIYCVEELTKLVENPKSEIQDPPAVYEVTGLQASLSNVKAHRLHTQHNKDPLTVDVWRVVSSI